MNPILKLKNVLLASVIVTIISGIAAKISQHIRNRRSYKINELLLYRAGDEKEKKQMCMDNLFLVIYVLTHANHSIDVCVSNLNSDVINNCLINNHSNKTKVRIVVHNSSGSNLQSFQDRGIKVKVIDKIEVRLEYEYILIDAVGNYKQAIAIIGCPYDGVNGPCNRDSSLLTSENAVVLTFKREFDRIWNIITDADKYETLK